MEKLAYIIAGYKRQTRRIVHHYIFGFRGVLQVCRARSIHHEASCYLHGLISYQIYFQIVKRKISRYF